MEVSERSAAPREAELDFTGAPTLEPVAPELAEETVMSLEAQEVSVQPAVKSKCIPPANPNIVDQEKVFASMAVLGRVLGPPCTRRELEEGVTKACGHWPLGINLFKR